MPIVNCPACAWAHPSLIAHCLRCNDTRHVLVPEPFPPGAAPREVAGAIFPLKHDRLGDALRELHEAMREADVVMTIRTRAVPDMPLAMGCVELIVETRRANQRYRFPQLFVELTPPSN